MLLLLPVHLFLSLHVHGTHIEEKFNYFSQMNLVLQNNAIWLYYFSFYFLVKFVKHQKLMNALNVYDMPMNLR